jgi:hypothetical protein
VDISKYGFGSNEDMQMIFNEMRNMWVSNGNKLSNQYTGTDSNITGVIETGKQGITGKLS